MTPVYKLSAPGTFKTGRTEYVSMLAENATYSPSDYWSIATVDVGAGGQSVIDFPNIPQTFKRLELVLFSNNTSSQGNVGIRFNSDSSNVYTYHYLRGSGTSPAAADWGTTLNYGYLNYDNNGSNFAARIVTIDDYTTSKLKTVKTLGGWDSNGAGISFQQSNLWPSSAAVTSIQLIYNAGTFAQNTHASLFGVKG